MSDGSLLGAIEALLDRGSDVREWPEDEARVYRESGRFEAGNQAALELRARKVLELVIAREDQTARAIEDARRALAGSDPAWSVLVWRADHLLLERVRPVLERLVVWADEPCERFTDGDWCGERRVGPLPATPCWPCRLKQLRAEFYRRSRAGGTG